jgi:hypothetical protein
MGLQIRPGRADLLGCKIRSRRRIARFAGRSCLCTQRVRKFSQQQRDRSTAKRPSTNDGINRCLESSPPAGTEPCNSPGRTDLQPQNRGCAASVLDRQSGGSSERRPQVPRGAQHGPAGDLDRLPGQGQQPGAERRPAEVVLVPQPRRELRCGRESVGRREHAHRGREPAVPTSGCS